VKADALPKEFANLIDMRGGHFLLESGHHGDLWLNLETLCSHPNRLDSFVHQLAQRISNHNAEMICGPLNEGAFVGLLVAREMGIEFCYTEPYRLPDSSGALYPVEYRLPRVLRERVRGRRVAIVNDVINAGSAVRGTHGDLVSCDAKVVVIGAFLTLGNWAADFATQQNIPLETIAQLPNNLWMPSECPMCAAGIPIERQQSPL